MTALANDQESDFAVQQSASLVPRKVAVGTGAITRLVKVTAAGPAAATIAPFEIVDKEFVGGAGAGGWPSNILTAIGYNASEYLQSGSGDKAKARNMLKLESGFYNPADQTYGPELYMHVGLGHDSPVGGSDVSLFRPLYIRPVFGTGSGSGRQFLPLEQQYSFTLFHIGQGAGGGFVVRAGTDGNHLLEVSKSVVRVQGPQLGMVNPVGAALVSVDGQSASTVQFRAASADSYSFTAASVDQLMLSDKAGAAFAVWVQSDPDSGLKSMDVRTALRVRGLHWVHLDAGVASSVLDGPTGANLDLRRVGLAAYDFLTPSREQMILSDKAGNAVAVWNCGATVDTRVTELRSVLRLGNAVGASAALPASPAGFFTIQDASGTPRRVAFTTARTPP